MNFRRYFTITLFVILLITSRLLAQNNDSIYTKIANYNINVALDTESKSLDGKMQLIWHNISNDTIKNLQFHLYLNAFKNSASTFNKEGRGMQSKRDTNAWGYLNIRDLQVRNGENLTSKMKFIQPDDDNEFDQTVVEVQLSEQSYVLPHKSIVLLCDFKSKLPEIVARTGFAGNYFFVAQWFPKIGVYEPAGMRYAQKGQWNCHQFHARSEFYADFGTYNVNITLPNDYIVGATGLQIDEIKNGSRTTHKFHAEKVVDFAWTASKKYKVKVTEHEGVKIKLLLQPEHKDQEARYFEAIKYSLEYYNQYLGKYPYPNITIVDPPRYGLRSGGMEYPTLITVGSMAYTPPNIRTTNMTTVHEFGHQYFMGILASNEFEEAWLDEGMNSYFESRIMDKFYGEKTSNIDFAGFRVGDTEQQRLSYVHNENRDIAESYRKSWNYEAGGYGMYSYMKPATFLHTLQRLVGDECMNDIMQTYYSRWKFRHPCSRDFIKIVNEVVTKYHGDKFGKNMNWFFDQVLYSNKVCDYKIEDIYQWENKKPEGIMTDEEKAAYKSDENLDKKYYARVLLKREENMVMPIELLIKFADGNEVLKTWDGKKRYKQFEFYSNSKVVSAEIDPEHKILMDVNLANNSIVLKPKQNPVWKYTVKFLFTIQNLLQSLVWFV